MDIISQVDKWLESARRIPLQSLIDSYNSIELVNAFDTMSKEPPMRFRSDGQMELIDWISITGMRTTSDRKLGVIYASLPSKVGFVKTVFSDRTVLPVHSHNFVEVAFVLEGEVRYLLYGKEEVFKKGEVFLLDKETKHADVLRAEDSFVLYVGINNTFFIDTLRTRGSHQQEITSDAERIVRDTILKRKEKYQYVRYIPKQEQTEAFEFVTRLLKEMLNLRAGCAYIVRGYVERIVSLLSSEFTLSFTQRDKDNAYRFIFDDVLAYIAEHSDSVTLSQLSDAFGYNPDYFSRLFNKHVGESYTHFLANTRLMRSAGYLISTKLSVEHIAVTVGFSNLGFFYRLFKEKYGMTPKEYRLVQAGGGRMPTSN